jgi:hypothetical protein
MAQVTANGQGERYEHRDANGCAEAKQGPGQQEEVSHPSKCPTALETPQPTGGRTDHGRADRPSLVESLLLHARLERRD